MRGGSLWSPRQRGAVLLKRLWLVARDSCMCSLHASAVRLVGEEHRARNSERWCGHGKAWQKCGRSGRDSVFGKALPSSGSAHASAPPMLGRPVSRQRLLLDALRVARRKRLF